MAGESPRREFYVATPEEIRSGQTSDIYFFNTLDVLKKAGKHRTKVLMETTVQTLPDAWPWAVFSGVEEVVNLLLGKAIDLWALPEGSLFAAKTPRGIPVPVLTVEGPYAEFCIFETPVLGFLCESSGIATKAARVRAAAGDRRVISFGIRRMHPALAPLIERCVYIGGLDAVTTPLGAAMLGKEPVGTMPHALTIVMGGPREAFRALQKHLEKKIPRIALADTYFDEKTESIIAAEEIKDLAGVRLDTPSSRRGNFAAIVREVRWELDLRGHKDAKIYVSGGLDETSIPALAEAGADGFGVGTSLSNAPTVDFAMDIVEREGKPVAKRGKFGGRKEPLRCGKCGTLEIGAAKCPACGGKMAPALVKYLSKGKPAAKLPGPDEIRKYVLSQLATRAA
ncbi:MAG: nicotinate phosphoribosyltransferase [Methanobacteriota archaeon]|nr:MAG: nicotinate phosphoribosyltransferase [Euryarchaeota archaeon]